MPVPVSYPGVYVREVSSGVRTITGVSTSIALFIGRTELGIRDRPTRLLNFSEYVKKFGEGTQESEMAHQVRQFFTNGGTQAYVMRIADDASEAGVSLHNENGDPTLVVKAKEAGRSGEQFRIDVDYDTVEPDKTFNLRVFRFVDNGAGGFLEEEQESFMNLTMDQSGARYAPDVVTQQSALISLEEPDNNPVARNAGVLVAGRVLGNEANTDVNEIISNGGNRLNISAGDGIKQIDLSGATTLAEVADAINGQIGPAEVAVTAQSFGSNNLLLITNMGNENVVVEPTGNIANDFALAMQLGTGQGGIEVGADANRRPAPSGLFFEYGANFDNLGKLMVIGQNQITAVTVDGTGPDVDLVTTLATEPMYKGLTSPVDSLLNLREKLLQLVLEFNDGAAALADFNWRFSLQGMRIVLKPTGGNANRGLNAAVATTPDDTLGEALQTANVRYYSLGSNGGGNFQSNGVPGDDGKKPGLSNYMNAFEIAKREIDLFNLLILPRDAEDNEDRNDVWGHASVFAQSRRAFLLVDPPKKWKERDNVTSASINIGTLRRGLVKDHAAIYWPRLTIIDPATNLRVNIDPSGSIAGLAARTDSNRGVWKAPAGLEAGIRSVVGVEFKLSDPDNGVINPQAVNAIRVFPNGIISWGARTMDGFDNSGNNDYKYLPVRRFALFIEESLYRGLKFAVFEPNDEPLWAQIRLAAGAFMNNLFRQGAFQGQKASDAYFVKVDAETTTQNEINLGIVNVIVGFAALKPAEFVVITIQQIAGQVQT